MAEIEKTEDLRVRRTRHLLEQAFWELLAEKGFQSVTVQEIAERAMVNRSTFYAHFVDKYALLQHSIRERFRETLLSEMSDEAEWSVDDLRRLVLTACEFLSGLRHHCMPRDAEVLPLLQTTITDLMAEILLDWISEVEPRESPDGMPPELAAAVTSWAIYGAAFHWSQARQEEPAEAFIAHALPMVVASLAQVIEVPG